MVSLTPRHWRSQPASATQAPPMTAPAMQTMVVPSRPAFGTAWPSQAQARPPSTSAPSPPMTTRPARAGSATHSAVSISGAARCSVFCHAKLLPNAPLKSVAHTSTGLAPWKATNTPNSRSAAAMAATGRSRLRSMVATSDRADDAFHQVVHLLELEVGLHHRLAGRHDHRALVVLQRALEDVEL